MKEVNWKHVLLSFSVAATMMGGIYFVGSYFFGTVTYSREQTASASGTPKQQADTAPEVAPAPVLEPIWPLVLDTAEYDKRLLVLSGYVPPKPVAVVVPKTSSTSATTTTFVTPPSPLIYSSTTNVTVTGKFWPKAAVYPEGGAILPFKRILAYYGNFYSRQMGILGEYEPDEVLRRLASTSAKWQAADPSTPVLPAIEYIAIVAQGSAGADGMYRAVMPDKEIDKAYDLAHKAKGILILDLQVGLSTPEREVSKFKKYLERPDVHLAIDPEFSMKGGQKPGTVIGTHNAADINYVINYLSTIVRDNKLPPKVLLVHRFTQNMVTGVSQIKPTHEVQVVMIMDGWGSKDLKRGTYYTVIEPEPVQFAGIKLFYKNDLKPPSTGMLTPAEVLDLHPKPIYIQYQ
jgi:hypothetical protein